MPGIGWWNVLVVSSGAASRSITAYDSITPITNHTFILNVVNEQMGKWVQLATAEPPQEFEFPFAANFTKRNGFNSYYCKDQLSKVEGKGYCVTANPTNSYAVVGQLPRGFTPKNGTVFAETFANSETYPCPQIVIDASGTFTCYEPLAAGVVMRFSFEFNA